MANTGSERLGKWAPEGTEAEFSLSTPDRSERRSEATTGEAVQETAAQVELRKEIIAKYLPDEQERARLASGELPLRQEEAKDLKEWLDNVDVEQTYRDDAYYKQFFGQESGFTHIRRSKEGGEMKHAFIDRVVMEKEARVRGLQVAMRAIGLTRGADGGFLIHAPDQPQERGEPINPLLTHSFMTGMERALSMPDPEERAKATEAVIDDVRRYLGIMQELNVTPMDILTAEAVVAPAQPTEFPVGLETSPLTQALQRAADEAWERQRRGPLDLGEMVRKQREEAERGRGAAQPSEPEIVFEEPQEIIGAPEVQPMRRPEAVQPQAERGPVIPPEAVAAARSAFDDERAKAPERTRLGWVIERTKGLLTAGVAEFRHFFGYGRAARQEAKAIERAYNEFYANNVGITPDQLSSRTKDIVDDAELRMMKRLRNYTNEYGESVVSTGPEIDQFRARLQASIEEAHEEQRRVDRRELRDLVLGAFDPKWHRRGVYGVIELALMGSGIKLLVDKWLLSPTKLPAPVPGPEGTVTVGPPEIVVTSTPPPDVSPMTKTIWHTLKDAYPGASNSQLIDASKEVIQQTQHLYEPAWTETVRHIEQIGDTAAQSTRALVEGTPLHGVFSEAVKRIMGVAARGAAGV